jgi:hypothetical protein
VPEIARWAVATGAHDVLRPVIWTHQEWMLRSSFGPLLARTLDHLVEDDLDRGIGDVDADGTVRRLVCA